MSLVLQITQAPSQVTVLFFLATFLLQYTWINGPCLLEPFVLLRSILWWKLRLLVALYCIRSWRNVSAIKSACCSCKRPGLSSHHPYGCSQPPVNLVPGDLMPSSGISGHQKHMWYTHINTDQTSKSIRSTEEHWTSISHDQRKVKASWIASIPKFFSLLPSWWSCLGRLLHKLSEEASMLVLETP